MRTENIYSVYVHKNLKNNKYYVGCTSKNPSYRWNNGKGYDYNTQMWKDIQESNWNTDWVHGILGKFDNKNDALRYEAFLIAMLDSVKNGYNTSSYGSGDFKRSEETKKKMSESQTGRVFTEEHKKKMSDNHADFSGEKNPNFGKRHSEESKKKMSEAKIGNHNRPQKPVLQFSKTGEFIAEYPSIMEASRQTGCNKGHICNCCKGKQKSACGYIWKYA